jgi:O-antigen ligase
VRGFVLAYLGLSAMCIVLTGSRSSFLGLLVFGAVTVWFSRRRWLGVAAAVIAVPVLWAAVPGTLQNRFETIIHPEVGPANAKESADSRLEYFYKGFDLWAEYPVTGCGPGAWKMALQAKMESHNLFAQLVGEMGLLGSGAFLVLLGAFWWNARWIRRAVQPEPDGRPDFVALLARALLVGVLLLLLLGNFGHNLYRFSWLWYGGFLLIAAHCVRERLRQGEVWQPLPLAA